MHQLIIQIGNIHVRVFVCMRVWEGKIESYSGMKGMRSCDQKGHQLLIADCVIKESNSLESQKE